MSARYLDDSGVTACWQSPWTSVQVPRANRRVCVPCLRHETISARVLREFNRINGIKTKRFTGTECLNGRVYSPEWCILWNQYTAEIGDYTTLAECVGSIDWREKTTTQRMETRIREKVPRPLLFVTIR